MITHAQLMKIWLSSVNIKNLLEILLTFLILPNLRINEGILQNFFRSFCKHFTNLISAIILDNTFFGEAAFRTTMNINKEKHDVFICIKDTIFLPNVHGQVHCERS